MFEALPQNCLLNLGTADLSALLYVGHEVAIHIEIVARGENLFSDRYILGPQTSKILAR